MSFLSFVLSVAFWVQPSGTHGQGSSRSHMSFTMTADRFPSRDRLGIDGQRAAVVVYLEDGAARVNEVLELFEDSGDDYAERGCRIVAVRKRASPDTAADFPSIAFTALESFEELHSALELDLQQLLYYPRAYLINTDGSIRAVGKGVRASTIWGEVTEALHECTTRRALVESKPTFQEDEAMRQESYLKNRRWAEVLEQDESLRQPTRGWFDGLGKDDGIGYLAAADSGVPLLPEAGAKPLVSADGVEAPEWYVRAKARADAKKAEYERQYPTYYGALPAARGGAASLAPSKGRTDVQSFGDIWKIGISSVFGETTPITKPEPLPSPPSPAAASPDDLECELIKLERELTELERDSWQLSSVIAAAAVREQIKVLKAELATRAAQASASARPDDAAVATQPAEAEAPSSSGFESVLERVGLLSLALSRSGTSKEAPRRIRLLKQLDASVSELEEEGFDDQELLQAWSAQIEAAWASVPPEVLAEREARAAMAKRMELKGNILFESITSVVDAIGDSLPSEVDFDVSKWRLRLRTRGKKIRKKRI